MPVCHGLTRPQQRCWMLAVGIPTGIMLLLHCFHVFSKTDTQIYHWWNLSIDCLVGARTSAHHSSFSLLTITQELIAKLRRFWPRDVSTSWWRFLTQGRQPSGFPRQWWGRFHQDAQYVWSYPLYVFILTCQHACNHIALYVYSGRKLCMTVCVESCWTHRAWQLAEDTRRERFGLATLPACHCTDDWRQGGCLKGLGSLVMKWVPGVGVSRDQMLWHNVDPYVVGGWITNAASGLWRKATTRHQSQRPHRLLEYLS